MELKTKQLRAFNKAATNALVCYIALTAQDWYVCRLPEFQVLQEWLCAELKQTGEGELWYPTDAGPDICVTCYKWYGHTLGGRLRLGCPECKDDSSNLLFWLPNLRDSLYVNDAHIEYLFANALWQWSNGRSRSRQLTHKYICENDIKIDRQVTQYATEVPELLAVIETL